MKALNLKERNIAMWKFIGGLLLVLIVVVLATTMFYTVPDTMILSLQDQVEDLNKQIPNTTQLVAQINTIEKEISVLRADSTSSSVSYELDSKKLADNILALSQLSSDSSNIDLLENNLAADYSLWSADIQKIRAMSGGGARLSDLQKQIQDLKRDNSDLNNKVIMYQNQNR